MSCVIDFAVNFNTLRFIFIQGLLGLLQSTKGLPRFETRITYACAFANAALDNTCPDLRLACPPGKVIYILDELYGKAYSLYRHCRTGAITNCSSMCCNGRTPFKSTMPISQEDQNELHSKCNDQNQCSLGVEFPKNITDHLEYVSVSYRCKVDSSFHMSGTTSSTPFTRTASVTASQFSGPNEWPGTNISGSLTTSAWMHLEQTRLSTQRRKQTLGSASVPVMAFIAPAVIIMVSVSIGGFLFWLKRHRRGTHATDVNPKPEFLHRNATHENNSYDSIALGGTRNSYPFSSVHEVTSEFKACPLPQSPPGDDCGNGQALNFEDAMKSSDTLSSSSARVYYNLDLQDRYNTIDPQHSFQQTTTDVAEYVTKSDEYNKLHFVTKTSRRDPNYDTMKTIPCMRIGDADAEYSHPGESETRPGNNIDYSHVTFQDRNEAKCNTDEDYSYLQCALNKHTEIVSDVAEYSHLDG